MQTTAVCRYFQAPQGCFRGDSCTFRHEKNTSNENQTNGDNSASHQQQFQPQQQQQQDDVAISASNPYAGNHSTGVTSSGLRQCRFYTAGTGCRNGTACPFAHVPPVPNPVAGGGGAYSAKELLMPPVEYGNSGMYYAAPPTQLMIPSPMDSYQSAPVLTPGVSTTPTNASTAASGATRRRLKIQANPQKKANYEVISEIVPVLTRDIEGPFYAIDVECVATGTGTTDRDVARIAVVDEQENVFYEQYVKPDKEIISYLTQLTGITESDLVGAPSLAEALVQLRAILPKNSVIVGQSIKKDLEWLGLEKGVDYRQMFDVADLFRIPMQATNGIIRYRFFSLRHVAKYLLGHNIQEADHDPVIDAKYAMKIFNQFRHLHENPGHRDAVYQTLLKTPRTPSFAERYPVIDGVAMREPRKPGSAPWMRDYATSYPQTSHHPPV